MNILKNIILQNRYFYIFFGLYLVVGLYPLIQFPKEYIVLWFNQYHQPILDFIAKYLTHFGDGIFALVICIILFFIHRIKALVTLLVFLISGGFVQILKHFVFINEPRPFKYLNESASLHLVEGVKIHLYESFPSGHSTSIFALCCCVALLFSHKKIGIILCLIAILTSLTRCYLVQHFFVDTYVGAMIGVSSATIGQYFYQKYEKNKV